MPRIVSFYLANLTLLLLPLYVVRFTLFGLPTTLLEILIVLTLISWLVEIVKAKDNLPKRWARIKHPVIWWGTGLVLVALISVFINPDHHSALGIWRAYFLEPFLFSLILVDLLRKNLPKHWLVYSLLGSGVWLSLMGLSQIVFHQPTTLDSLHEVEQGRAAAVYNSANALALYLGPLFALSVFLALKRVKKYYLYWLIAGLFLSAILLTKSTGAKLGLGAIESLVILNFFWSMVKPGLRDLIWKVAAILGSFSLAALLILFLNISSFTPKTHFTFPRTYTDTKTIRLCLWEGTKQILTTYPVTGVGLAGFQNSYAAARTCDSELLAYPHNIFLNFWSETTILGMIIFIVLQTKIWLLLRKSSDRLLAVGLAAAFGYLVLHGLVDVPYFKNDLAVEYWVLVALAIATAENKLQLE